MDNLLSRSSLDTQNIEIYPASIASDVSFLKGWIKQASVSEEIRRGNELRETKPFSRPIVRRPALINNAPHSPRKRRKRETFTTQNNASICGCSNSLPQTYELTKSSSSHSTNRSKRLRKRNKKVGRCSMRLAELAVPSKRHCIDTWRHKSYLLPESMVDRLKQHVMNQRPVVQITDAITSFQMKNSRKIKRSPKNKNNLQTIQRTIRFGETKILCLLFAQKIMQKLSIPLNLSLNEELQKVYEVVGDEVARIISSKENLKRKDLERYKLIHCDVTNKITVWIGIILEELKYKLLEEDLRELEETEGPVLDFLDEVLNRVLDICLPEPSVATNSDYFDSCSNLEYRLEEEKTTSTEELSGSGDKLTDSEHIRHQISQQIDNICKESESYLITDMEYFPNIIHSIIIKIFKELIMFPDEEYFKNEIYDLLSIVWKESEENVVNTLTSQDESNVEATEIVSKSEDKNENDNLDSNVGNNNTEAPKFALEGEDPDKNVISDLPIADQNEIVDHLIKSVVDDLNLHEKSEDRDNLKRIIFAVPNLSLLSTADEVWPRDILSSSHILRPSTSVTKSVTSLGNLRESDEICVSPSLTDSIGPKSLIKDEMITSVASFTNIQTLEENFGNVCFNRPEAKFELTKTIASIENIIQNNKDVLKPHELNIIIIEKLKQIIATLPNTEVVKCIAMLVNELKFDGEMLPPEALNDNMIKRLSILNGKLQDAEIEKYQDAENLEESERIKELIAKLQDAEIKNHQDAEYLAETERLNHLIVPSQDAEIEKHQDVEYLAETERLKRLIVPLQDAEIEKHQDADDLAITERLKHLMVPLQDAEIEKHEDAEDLVESERIKHLIAEFVADKVDAECQTESNREELLIKTVNLTEDKGIETNSLDNNTKLDMGFTNKIDAEQSKEEILIKTGTVETKAKIIADPLYKETEEKGTVTDSVLDTAWNPTAPCSVRLTKTQCVPKVVKHRARATVLTHKDIRNWCKDIDTGFQNLEIWRDWLSCSCKDAAYLLRKKKSCSKYKYQKDWTNLRNNIAEDACLWRQMNQKTYKHFQKYNVNFKVTPMKLSQRCFCENTSHSSTPYCYTQHSSNNDCQW